MRPRPLGSPNNQTAAGVIRQALELTKLSVESQSFACPLWEHEETSLSVRGEHLTVAANLFSDACDITAPIVPVATFAELKQARLADCIVLLHGDLTRDVFPAAHAIYFPEREQAIIRQIASKRPAAVLTVNPQPGVTESLIQDLRISDSVRHGSGGSRSDLTPSPG